MAREVCIPRDPKLAEIVRYLEEDFLKLDTNVQIRGAMKELDGHWNRLQKYFNYTWNLQTIQTKE